MTRSVTRPQATIARVLLVLLGIVHGSSAIAESGGSIAYVRPGKSRGDEIRGIDTDGGRDRSIWKIPGPAFAGVTGLAWKPDGNELAFASDHDAAGSVFESDIYAIRPDGSGLRKLTNRPLPPQLARYTTGRLTVTLSNRLTDSSLFVVYAAGCTAGQRVVVPPGGSKRVLFADIADTGSGPHPVVAIDGKSRWIVAGPIVQAGSTADAGVLTITAHPMEHFGATSPAWSADGKRIAFVLAQSAGIYSVGAGPELASKMERSVIGDSAIPASIYDLGPVPGLANQIIYGGAVGDQAIYRTTEGSGKRGERLVTCDAGEALLQAQWLPDGSGFLFAKTDFTKSDIYRYELATRRTAPVTHMSHEYAGAFSVSPDGRTVVFERSATLGESRIDLWTARLDGTGMKLLVRDGKAPAWGR